MSAQSAAEAKPAEAAGTPAQCRILLPKETDGRALTQELAVETLARAAGAFVEEVVTVVSGGAGAPVESRAPGQVA